MLTLDTLNMMLAVSEEGLIEEVVITLLASPQLAAFFEKFPKLKSDDGRSPALARQSAAAV